MTTREKFLTRWLYCLQIRKAWVVLSGGPVVKRSSPVVSGFCMATFPARVLLGNWETRRTTKYFSFPQRVHISKYDSAHVVSKPTEVTEPVQGRQVGCFFASRVCRSAGVKDVNPLFPLLTFVCSEFSSMIPSEAKEKRRCGRAGPNPQEKD